MRGKGLRKAAGEEDAVAAGEELVVIGKDQVGNEVSGVRIAEEAEDQADPVLAPHPLVIEAE